MFRLICGTESTWSLRAWMCAHLVGVQFEEQVIQLGAPGYKVELRKHSETGLVPVLDTVEIQIHDSLAIGEYLNELSGGILYPVDRWERARARSLCAELHSGFPVLREGCPFSSAGKGIMRQSAGMERELLRLEAIFTGARLPFMFDRAGMVDVFYAIMAYRLEGYNISLPGKAGEYQQSLLGWDMLKAAITRARGWENMT